LVLLSPSSTSSSIMRRELLVEWPVGTGRPCDKATGFPKVGLELKPSSEKSDDTASLS
jgi:hypothetical protein